MIFKTAMGAAGPPCDLSDEKEMDGIRYSSGPCSPMMSRI
jgi:hypothetical protein